MKECILSVDIGTTSLKTALITATGEVVSFCSMTLSAPQNRFVAEGWVWALKGAIDKLKDLLNESGIEAGVMAVAISGNGPTVVSETGLTIRWNEITGKSIETTSLFIPKIMRMKVLYDQTFNETNYIYSGPEYLINKLTGATITILPEERFKPAYWSFSELSSFDIPEEKLPPFVPIGCNCGTLLPEAAGFFGIDANTPVIGVGPDFVSALIGTNTVHAGEICDRSGSSEGLNYCIPKEVHYEGLRTLPSVIPGLWNISYLIPDSAELSEEERFASLKKGLEMLKKVAAENDFPFADKLTVTGGQAKDEDYLKRKAAALGMKLAVSECTDAELIGDAAVAFTSLGTFASIQDGAEKLCGAKLRVIE